MWPFAFSILAVVPELNFGLSIAALALTFGSLLVCLQEAFDVGPRASFLVAGPAFALWAIVMPLFVTADNPFGAGLFNFDFSNEALESIINAFKQLAAFN